MSKSHQVLRSQNPIAPKIFVTSDGQLLTTPLSPATLEKPYRFEENFFHYDQEKDLIVFKSFWEGGERIAAAHGSDSYPSHHQAKDWMQYSFIAYVEGKTIHANGTNITFDRPLTLVFGNDNLTLEICDNVNGKWFRMSEEPSISSDLPTGLDVINTWEWLTGFKLEGNKIISIESREDSCNLFMQGSVETKQDPDSKIINIDFGLAHEAGPELPASVAVSEDGAAAHIADDMQKAHIGDTPDTFGSE